MSNVIKYKLLSDTARAPVKNLHANARYNLYSPHSLLVDPCTKHVINTNILLELPSGYTGKIVDAEYSEFIYIDSEYISNKKIIEIIVKVKSKAYTILDGDLIAYLDIIPLQVFDLINMDDCINNKNTIKFKKIHPDAIIPTRGTENSAGFDVYAIEDTLVVGGEGNVKVDTGIAVQLLPGTYGRISMRSGIGYREHLAVTCGVIDRDYVDSFALIIYCTKIGHKYLIKKGERVAQIIPEKVSYASGEEVNNFIINYNIHKGWGSTGN